VIMDDNGGAVAIPTNTWLTYDECISKHGVNPIGRENVRNKLRRNGHDFARVWLEADVIDVKEKKP
jgi:hypothetical protein